MANPSTFSSFPSPQHQRYTRYHTKDKPATVHEHRRTSVSSDATYNTAVTSSTEPSPQRLRHSRPRAEQSSHVRQSLSSSSSSTRPSLGARSASSPSSHTLQQLSSPTHSLSLSSPPRSPSRHASGRLRHRLNTLSTMLETSSGGLQRSMSYGAVALGGATSTAATGGPQSAQAVYQHIVETATKRISTLDYLRKSHEGRVYWFNTLLYTKSELLKLPYFTPQRLARRAQNYLLLGFSLPMILDLNSQTPNEYLKALGALMAEFEQYQSMHPPDGSSASSSLSRARIPSMFKRAAGAGNKARRMTDASIATLSMGSSSSSQHNLPNGTSTSNSNTTTNNSNHISSSSGASTHNDSSGTTHHTDTTASSSASAPPPPPVPSLPIATSAEPLLPTEQYTHLLTPPLPFDPDFFETFATLCDVLIDCYSRVTQLVSGPEACGAGSGVGELFAKMDARVRKVLVNGVVREFEERSREAVKGEIAGVGKVILGGLM